MELASGLDHAGPSSKYIRLVLPASQEASQLTEKSEGPGIAPGVPILPSRVDGPK
jgi:hypothetical protein